MPQHIALLGGSFNPPHIGHFQLAYTALEGLGLEQVLFLPCANPPHKPQNTLLPFALRCELLHAYIHDKPFFGISTIEQERKGPSYTVETLTALTNDDPRVMLYFIMGTEDLLSFTKWYKWDEILTLTNIIAVPRARHYSTSELTDIAQGIDPLYSLAKHDKGSTTFTHPQACTIHCLDQPILEISSTLIRKKWLNNEALDLFLPDKVLSLLNINRDVVTPLWADSPDHMR